MVDDPQANQTAEGQQQPASMPNAEQQVPEVNVNESASPQGESPQTTNTEVELPEGTKERTTREFEKLKTQLAQERQQRMKIEQMFSGMRQSQPQPVNQVPDYFNPETGEINVDKLEARNRQLESQLQQLSGTVKSITEKEQIQQEQEAYASYPELNPNNGNKFNQVLHRAVTGYLTDAYLRGENPTMKQAADAINGIRAKDIKEAEKKGATQAMQQLTPKEQASLEATGRSDRRTEVIGNLERLQQRSREGDFNAIAERLKNISSVNR